MDMIRGWYIIHLAGCGWEIIEDLTSDHLLVIINTRVEQLRVTPNK